MSSKVRVADVVADALVAGGITHCFMLTGGGSMHLNDGFGFHPGLKSVFCHHEQALSMAADAYARITSRPACVNVTTGPGGVNALNGVFGAYTDSLPMIVVSGQAKRETLVALTGLPLRQIGDQEVDIVSMVKPITKMAEVLMNPADALYLTQKMIYFATTGRPGPVWLDIPIDVQAAPVDPATLRQFDPVAEGFNGYCGLPMEVGYLRGDALEQTCRTVLARLQSAKRPVIVVGGGVRVSNSHAAFLKLIEQLGIPVTTAFNAHDVLPDTHPMYAGRSGSLGTRGGNFAVQNSDFCLVLGSRLSLRQVSYNFRSFARSAFKVMVDIDRAELVKPTISIDLPVHARLVDFIGTMSALLGKHEIPAAHGEYLAWSRERHARYPAVLPRHYESKGSINPYVFVKQLFQQLDPGDIVVCADGTACVVTFQAAELKEGQRLFHNSGSASMGYDLPGAIGACYTDPPTGRVICIAGDGSVMQNIQELQTIVGGKLPVKLIVLNNNGYHSIRQAQQNYLNGASVGCGPDSGITFPDFVQLSAGFGLPATSVDGLADLDSALSAFLEGTEAALLEVVIDQDQVFEPRLGSRRLEDGSMVTSPLEDQSPLLSREELAENILVPMVND